MHDERFGKLAKLLVEYSIRLKRNETVLIEAFDTPDEMTVALIRAARNAGGVPFAQVYHARVIRTLDYRKLQPGMKALKGLLEQTDCVQIKGPGTDLNFSIKGIPAVICGGDRNIPDGEVFTAPVKDSVEGQLTFNAPSIYQGTAFDSIQLNFKRGKIVEASSNEARKLNKILDSDAGARYIGEFSLGFNPRVFEPMRD